MQWWSDSTESTQAISRGALRLLSEAMNDVTLTGWRRIQLMAKERTTVSIRGVFKLAILRQGTILSRMESLLPGCRADRDQLSAVIQGPWKQETLMAQQLRR